MNFFIKIRGEDENPQIIRNIACGCVDITVNTKNVMDHLRLIKIKELLYLLTVLIFAFDTILAISTAVFIVILAKPMISKIERIKNKYGLDY